MTIKERFDLLLEAEQFYADLSEAGEDNYSLGLRKAAALGTVRECLDLFKEKMLKDKDWSEETLKAGLDTVVDEEYIENMVKTNGMSEDEAEFYRGGFGLAIGILEGDEETINGLKELQDEYEKLIERKAQDKTIADLLK